MLICDANIMCVFVPWETNRGDFNKRPDFFNKRVINFDMSKIHINFVVLN